MQISKRSKELIDKEDKYGAHNYHPLPVVLTSGNGVYVTDVDGKQYIDFLSAYSAVNQGHCHPKIVAAATGQLSKLTLTSRAFYSDALGEFAEFLTKLFGFDKMLPMNSGAEAVETALKLAKKWAYKKKKVEEGKALIIVCDQNFHGRTTTIISFSSDPDARGDYAPYTPGFIQIPYNDLETLEMVLKENESHLAAFLVEPIQGEAGILIPENGYLKQAKALCEKYNTLLIADEIQTGIARTGKMLACDHEGIKPDVLILGKALSGGMYPVSAVLADNDIMLCIKPGQHGSTYGGNPLACKIAIAALKVVLEENLSENAQMMGELFRHELSAISKNPLIKEIRGKGLLNAIEINDSPESKTAWNICLSLAENGLLAKPTHGNIIRLAPPLVINEAQIKEAAGIIVKVVRSLPRHVGG